jgi:periplasmic divalent cation tolerance protein
MTAPNRATARTIARGLVEARLAACVNVIPGVTSHYSWKGRLHCDSEILLVAKTRAALLREIIKFVRRRHPAEVPEIVALPISGGDKPYLDWLRCATAAG